MTDHTLILTARDVAALLDTPSCVAAIERGLSAYESQPNITPTSLGLMLPLGRFHVKAAALAIDGRTVIVAKGNVNLPGNPARTGRPTIQGALMLLDADTGQPLAIMDSTVVTSVRTGAVTAVAAKRLALDDAATATIVGCGEQGEIQLRSLIAVRPLRQVFAIDVDPSRAASFADRLSSELNLDVVTSADLTRAASLSQIVVTCTTASLPFITAEHLHPGLFVSAIGADNPSKHEIAASALAAALVVVDSLDACASSGDLHHAIAAGLMQPESVHATLSAIVAGRAAGRQGADEIFVLDSVGTALQDVAAAALVYSRAVEQGRGVAVDLGGR